MSVFLSENFMLKTDIAKKLYHDYAKNIPIIDYHCHINPKDIADNTKYGNLANIWLTCGDHYKWRAIRSNGYDEKYIAGDGSDYEKFIAWANTVPKCIGNPLYVWAHMELKKYFGYGGVLNGETADIVWNLCNEKLQDNAFSAREIMKKSDVKIICTTDDPADSLEYHRQIAADKDFDIKILPAFRPDKGLHIEKAGFADYINKLSQASGIEITSMNALFDAYANRLDFFVSLGCKTADNGFESVLFKRECGDIKADSVLKKALAGQPVNQDEADVYKTELMLFLAKEYHKRNLIMQIHFGVSRNNSIRLFNTFGPDTGGDAIGNYNCIMPLTKLLGELDRENTLPKTVLYSVNPTDNVAIDALIGCFQNNDCGIKPNGTGKLQHGSAWWFNDNNMGMREQLINLANNSLLSNFIGMLTDSRSFLSYTRHDYFRRILCDVIGEYVVNGEYPDDIDYLAKIVSDICFANTKNYFEF